MAKSISLSINKPFLPVNHLEGHILSPRIENGISFPYLVLLVTGGHTMLVIAHKLGKYQILGLELTQAQIIGILIFIIGIFGIYYLNKQKSITQHEPVKE